jgi:hypothetical protein
MTPKEIAQQINENIDVTNGLEDQERPGVNLYINAVRNALGQPAGSLCDKCLQREIPLILDRIESGETDIEALSDLSHQVWSSLARMNKTGSPEEIQNRMKLANTNYYDLPEEEKEKDRQIVRMVMRLYNKNLESALGV